MNPRTTRAKSRHELAADGTAGYRSDIDGLRALAIVLVVVYHVWLGRVSGGVDVFLMISAFFLTSSFARRVKRGLPLTLGAFWIRKFRRLLPAAAVTILGVVAIALTCYPEVEWPRVWRDAWSSLFYFENWTLAVSNVDYYARNAVTPSAFQHFWSLSVQGQVFIIWPLLIALVAVITRRHLHLALPLLWILFSLLFAGSLAFSIYETAAAQSFAYFDSRTRLWEFAAGSLVALALPNVRLPAVVRTLLGWLGVVGIVICGLVLDVQGGFPGYFALWPVLCTAAVIVAGSKEAPYSPSRLLASRPLRFLGRDAYALYLVHWPILITWRVITDRPAPGPYAGLAIILLSFLIARVVAWGVEEPLRHAAVFDRNAWRGAAVVAGAVVVVAAPLTIWQTSAIAHANNIVAAGNPDYPGAAQIGASTPLPSLPLKPPALLRDRDWVDLGVACDELEPSDPRLGGSCMSNRAAHDPTAPLVLVMGDSHAQQLSSPLRAVADDNAWGLVALLKGGCSIGVNAPSTSITGPPCEEWRHAALDYALELKPAAVYLIVTRATADGQEEFINGIQDIIEDLTREGIPVVAVRDNPRFAADMYVCASEGDHDCDVPRVPSTVDMGTLETASDLVTAVDFTPWLCPDGVCHSVIGNIAVYLDDNHVTDSYGRTMGPMLAKMLSDGGFPLPALSGASVG
ncbi:acyltransferase family protein [Microbacterium sp.]|uniref:acyltransferase family protein n=1 Tax=Microbacterium sp. TaxID=51671 RepID=UPI003C768CC1